jgi:hypothetical protein
VDKGSSQQLMGRGRVERERENGRNGNEVNKNKT